MTSSSQSNPVLSKDTAKWQITPVPVDLYPDLHLYGEFQPGDTIIVLTDGSWNEILSIQEEDTVAGVISLQEIEDMAPEGYTPNPFDLYQLVVIQGMANLALQNIFKSFNREWSTTQYGNPFYSVLEAGYALGRYLNVSKPPLFSHMTYQEQFWDSMMMELQDLLPPGYPYEYSIQDIYYNIGSLIPDEAHRQIQTFLAKRIACEMAYVIAYINIYFEELDNLNIHVPSIE